MAGQGGQTTREGDRAQEPVLESSQRDSPASVI